MPGQSSGVGPPVRNEAASTIRSPGESLTPGGWVMTVLGPVEARTLGPTLTHEHLLVNGLCFLEDPVDAVSAALVDAPVTAANRTAVMAHSCVCRDNVILDDDEVMGEEVLAFAAVGGGAIVDVTPSNLRVDPAAAELISRKTGVHVILGTGPYCEYTLDPELAARDADQIRDDILHDLLVGIPGSGIRAGVIGEIGVDGRAAGAGQRHTIVTSVEERGLRGAARASLVTGVPIVVHQPSLVEAPEAITAVLEDEGVPPDQVCLGHMSSVVDLEVHIGMARRGYWIAYDNFGMEIRNRYMPDVTDRDRIAWVVELAARGLADRLLVSHDVWSKVQLRASGGGGFVHLHEMVLPAMRASGVTGEVLEQVLTVNPAVFLGRRHAHRRPT